MTLAVALGVALAFSVQVINDSALAEFGAAVHAVNGEPDLSLRGNADGLPDLLLDRVALHPGVRLASPVLEIDTYAAAPAGRREAVRVLGIDALQLPTLAPELMPQPAAGQDRLVALDPGAAFANASPRARLGLADAAVASAPPPPAGRSQQSVSPAALSAAPTIVPPSPPDFSARRAIPPPRRRVFPPPRAPPVCRPALV